ncbi:MAG TPA: hypothetical protein PKK39_09885, partial [Tepidiformaceae bacterium]|nr:hypothetical protein [Tepidiformaceae bacterium]
GSHTTLVWERTVLAAERRDLVGDWFKNRNIAANVRGGIHDDEAAKRLGFRGAWVSGRVHLSTFAPVLVEAFGPAWFEHGSISMDFRSATIDQEDVRAILCAVPASPSNIQLDARMESADGTLVAIGTAANSVGAEPTYLGRKNLTAYDQPPYELVDEIVPGDVFEEVEYTPTLQVAQRIVDGSVALDWYTEASPWGPPIAAPGVMVSALGAACHRYLRAHPFLGVPVDGATELRNINGPIFMGETYRVGGRIVARGRSPRSEYFWYESWMDDLHGKRIAEMLLQWRCIKNW